MGNSYANELTELDKEVVTMNMEKSVLNEVEKNIEQNKYINVYKLLSLLSGTEYEKTFSEQVRSLNDLLTEREKALYDAKPNNLSITRLNEQIEERRKILYDGVQAMLVKIGNREKNINRQIEQSETKFLNVPNQEIELARLQRLFIIKEKFYTLLLEKKA